MAVRTEDEVRLGRAQIEILQHAEGYFSSQVLFTLNELGVFDLLATEPKSLAELARAVGALPDPMERVLNAGVAIGLLRIADGHYSNSEAAKNTLVSGGRGYLGSWVRLMQRWMRAWTGLTESVLSGQPAEDPSLHLGGDPDYTLDFTMGMHDYAQLRGSEVVGYVDFSRGGRLLDVGGGPGTYSILFCRQWPDLHCTVFDLPDVARLAAQNAVLSGVEGRVSVRPGNYHEDDFGREEFDFVFVSDTLHQESPETCEMILRKAHRALKPGGQVVVQAMFLNGDRMSPRWPVMHSLILLLVYEGGRAYTVTETIRLLERAGFRNCTLRLMSLLNVNSLLVADKD